MKHSTCLQNTNSTFFFFFGLGEFQVINAERNATTFAPDFRQLLAKTRETMLNDILKLSTLSKRSLGFSNLLNRDKSPKEVKDKTNRATWNDEREYLETGWNSANSSNKVSPANSLRTSFREEYNNSLNSSSTPTSSSTSTPNVSSPVTYSFQHPAVVSSPKVTSTNPFLDEYTEDIPRVTPPVKTPELKLSPPVSVKNTVSNNTSQISKTQSEVRFDDLLAELDKGASSVHLLLQPTSSPASPNQPPKEPIAIDCTRCLKLVERENAILKNSKYYCKRCSFLV